MEKQQWWFVEPYDEIFQEYDSFDGYPAHIKDNVDNNFKKLEVRE
ncbi:MAG: hypothetical protein ACE5SW_04035 [Nitrososphaeraceae archaeon]